MAKLIINLELNNKIGEEVEKIKTSLQGIQVPKTSLANTAQLQKSYANLFNTIKNSKGAYPEDVFKGVEEQVNKNLQAIKGLNTSFKTNGELTEQEKELYSQLKKELNQLSAQFATIRAQTGKLEKTNKLAIPSVDNLRKRYADLLNTIQNTSKYYKKGTFDDITTKAKGYLEELKGLDSTSETYAEDVNRLDKNLNQLSADFAETRQSATNFHGSLQDIVSGFLKFQVAAMLVMKPLQMIRNAWASINETLVKTEDAVVSLQRVLNDDSLSDETISGKLYDLAVKYGQTFENANEIAQNFARTGMNWNETIKATEAALLALNVAELDATQASDGLIAIMQQFGYEASNLTGIIDILNKTADNYAVTTDKLLTALQRTGSSAKNANLSLEQTVGIVTALSEATGRSGENLGTAVNSLIQFSTKSSALDTFAKLSDNMATLVEDFRHGKGTVLDIWQGLSAEIKNASGSNENILSGLFGDDDWRSLNEELQDALGENFAKVTEIYDTASTFRKNYFIALLNNMDTVEKAIGTASDAAGYSQKENEKYLDTYTAKLNKLKAQWQKLTSDEKGILGLKKVLVWLASKLLWLIDKIGGLKTVVFALGTTVWTLFGAKFINQIKLITKNFVAMFKEIKGGALSLNSTLGVIGIVATALSLVKGLVDSFKGEDTTSEDVQGVVDNLDKLSTKLNTITKEASETTTELSKINAVLISESSTTDDVAKAKNSLLEIQNNLIKNNQAYKGSIDLVNASYEEQLGLVNKLSEEKMRKLVENYLAENKSAIQTAQGYLAPITNAGIYFHSDRQNEWQGNFGETDFQKWLKEQGYSVDSYYTSDGFLADFWTGLQGMLGKETRYTGISVGSKTREEQLAILNELFEKAKGYDASYDTAYASVIADAIAAINNDTYKNAQKLLYGDKNSENWIERLTYEQQQQFASGELSYKEVLKILGLVDEAIEDAENATKSWEKQSEKIVSNYQDILDIINAARDSEQEIVDLEEKKIELQKAQQALEDAKNNRNVRVYNASTGNWELEADRDKVYEAQEKVWQAEKSLENATWNVLENEIKEGNMTAGEIYEKVKELANDFPDLAQTIRDAFVSKGYKMPEYDSGGVLRGLGGIKATSQDEIILPPDLAKKILQPTSNAEFAQFAKSLGLLFGSSKQVADMKSGMVVNNGGSTSTDNRSYVANGIPFSRETAETHTLAELFEMAANFNN